MTVQGGLQNSMRERFAAFGTGRKIVAGLAATIVLIAIVLISHSFGTDRLPGTLPDIALSEFSATVASEMEAAIDRVKRQPRDAAAWGQLGMLLLAHENDDTAAHCLEQAAKLDPLQARWPYLHALCAGAADRQLAIALLQRAIQIDATVGAAQSRLGEFYLEAGELQKAEAVLRSAVQQQPYDVRPRISLAQTLQRAGDLDAARIVAEAALRTAPECSRAYSILATIFFAAGDEDTARSLNERAQSLPDHPLMWHDPVSAEVMSLRRDPGWEYERAEAQLANGYHPIGIRMLSDVLQRDQSDPRVFCGLARACMEIGDLETAEHTLTEAETRHPAAAQVRFLRGVLLLLRQRDREACTAFREAIAVKPDYAMAHFNLGIASERSGDSTAALHAFQAAVRCQPTLVPGHLKAAELLLLQNRHAEARRHIAAAQQLQPGHPETEQLASRAAAVVPVADEE